MPWHANAKLSNKKPPKQIKVKHARFFELYAHRYATAFLYSKKVNKLV